MKRCVKIKVMGKVQGVAYRAFAQKHAHDLNVEGTIQNADDGSVVILACGPSENLDKLIDHLYKGTSKSVVVELTVEPLINEKDFRGVFRIIGE
jgi:acylphosphatase